MGHVETLDVLGRVDMLEMTRNLHILLPDNLPKKWLGLQVIRVQMIIHHLNMFRHPLLLSVSILGEETSVHASVARGLLEGEKSGSRVLAETKRLEDQQEP